MEILAVSGRLVTLRSARLTSWDSDTPGRDIPTLTLEVPLWRCLDALWPHTQAKRSWEQIWRHKSCALGAAGGGDLTEGVGHGGCGPPRVWATEGCEH